MRTCPQCGQNVREENSLCPFCGTELKSDKPSQEELDWKRKDTVTSGAVLGCGLTALIYFFYGAAWFVSREMLYMMSRMTPDQQAGWMFSATHGIWIGFSLPIAVTGLLYLLLRRRFPLFARGLGYSCVVAVVVALGAPFWCGGGSAPP